MIKTRYSPTDNHVFVINCTFGWINTPPAIRIDTSLFNKSVSFINCIFHNNMELISITTIVCRAFNDCELSTANAIMSTNMMLTNISFVKCQFIGNSNRVIITKNTDPIFSNLKANIFLNL